GLPNRRQRKLIEDRAIQRVAWLSRSEQIQIAVEDRTVIGDVVQIAIRAAYRNIERRAGSKAKQWRDADMAQRLAGIQGSGKRKPVPAVLKAARELATEVRRNQCV